MKKKKIVLLGASFFFTITCALAGQTFDEYQGVELRKKLYESTKKNHVALIYQEAKKVLFSTVENIEGVVCSVYTEGQCQMRSQRSVDEILKKKPRGFKLNTEHTWPQSKGAKKLPANSDMHHLFVTSKESNSKRGNFPFGEVEVPVWEFGGSAQGIDINSQDCFEPPENHKGNVARAMFYFSIRYKMAIDQFQEAVFRNWHISDPVDAREIERDLLIKSIQGNSNPFIHNQLLVDRIENF